jgi:hypothetical protein
MQFSFATAAVANASIGRMPWAGIEQVGPDRYVVRGSWPQVGLPAKATKRLIQIKGWLTIGVTLSRISTIADGKKNSLLVCAIAGCFSQIWLCQE